MEEPSQKTYLFHVNGMHCAACILMIESTLTESGRVSRAKVDLAANSVEVTGVFGDTSPDMLAEEFTSLLRPYGYTLSVGDNAPKAQWGDFAYALPLALTFIAAFLLLQKAGLTSLITSAEVSYGTAFLIGLIASVSSCLAVVGGLVLSLGATSAREGGTWRTQALFHVGRFGGFFVLGGAVGLLGSSFQLGLTANVILGVLVALVMLILGINLLDVFRFTKRLQITMPARFSRYLARGAKRHDHYLAPLLIGIGTFFLPCGFTQSMQLYALSTGNFMQGALTMTVFALGTFPVLALLSFGSLNIAHKPWKGIFFKTAGLVVVALALLTLLNTLATTGVISPLIVF